MQISRSSRLSLLAVGGALLVAGASAPLASAGVVRYASPAGSGSACTAASPCGFAKAVGGAAIGAEVIVTPGDYQLTGTVATAVPMTIHGIAGKPRPRLRFSGGQEGLRLTHASTLRYVEIDQAPGSGARALYAADSALVDQVIARTSGAANTATIQSSTIRNSIVVASGDGGRALVTDANDAVNTSTYRNVTAIASGANGIAIQVSAGFAGGHTTVSLINVIARGPVGLEARTDSSGAQATINVIHTNYIAPVKAGTYATIVNWGGNQSSAPIFANWPVGDYRQGLGSVTIDAGNADPSNGSLDVEGDPRNFGIVDIGADEIVPAPAATTGGAGAITYHSATLTGSVDAHGGPTKYHFEYGPTTAYGRSTAMSDAGTSTAAASASLSGVAAATTYHYRLVATNSGGVGKGADRTFTTAAAPPPAPAPASTPPFAGVALASTRLTYGGKFVALRLRCPAGTVGGCSGRTRLTARRQARSVTLGRAGFSIAAGDEAKVRVRVSRGGRRLLGRVRRLRGKDRTAAYDGAGGSKTTVAAVTIRRRHR
jgi:hypothetical protein